MIAFSIVEHRSAVAMMACAWSWVFASISWTGFFNSRFFLFEEGRFFVQPFQLFGLLLLPDVFLHSLPIFWSIAVVTCSEFLFLVGRGLISFLETRTTPSLL